MVANLVDIVEYVSEGSLVYAQGQYSDLLIRRGLYPGVADVFVSIDGVNVTHLNANEV